MDIHIHGNPGFTPDKKETKERKRGYAFLFAFHGNYGSLVLLLVHFALVI